MIAVKVIALLVIGYCFGLIQTGYFYSKIKGIDIKHQGSGNSGATNSLRVMGVKAGVIVLIGDIAKSVIPCLAVRYIFSNLGPLGGLNLEPDMSQAYVLIMGLGAVLGHVYPFYLGFNGGKGIATTGGIAIAFDWRIAIIGLTAFILVVVITKYVSVGSMTGVLTFCVLAMVFNALGWYHLCTLGQVLLYVTAAILIVNAAYSHRANWKRLANGTENKFGSKKDKK